MPYAGAPYPPSGARWSALSVARSSPECDGSVLAGQGSYGAGQQGRAPEAPASHRAGTRSPRRRHGKLDGAPPGPATSSCLVRASISSDSGERSGSLPDSGEFHGGRSPAGAEYSARQRLARFSGHPRFSHENLTYSVSRGTFPDARKKFYGSATFSVTGCLAFAHTNRIGQLFFQFGALMVTARDALTL